MPLKHYVTPLLIALALFTLDPGSAIAAKAATASPIPTQVPSRGDDAHPLVMQQTAASEATARTGPLQPFQPAPRTGANAQAGIGGAGGPQREVFGFALLSSLADPTVGYPSWNFSLLSTVAVFGLHVQTDGNFAADSSWNEWNSSQVSGLVSTARQHGTRVVLTIILQDFSAGTPNMCAGLKNRATTVQQTVAQVVATGTGKGVDGVNIDYEGLGGTCANGENPRTDMIDLARQLRAALPAGSYLSVDTYASSAGDPLGFFDVPGLSAYVDSFFVMAYDSDWSNYNHAPLNCSRYCLNPVSPLTGYYYNDTRTATEYSNAVPSSKVILGLPYYGRYTCVNSWAPNQYPAPGWSTFAITYRASVTMPSDPTNSNYALNRDANDAAGMTPWSTWWSSSNPKGCPVESYWDDTTSLGQKYDLVNLANLRGVGLWNLNQGGGSPELWSTLNNHFSCPVTVSGPAASPATTQFSVNLTAGSCSVTSFDVQQYDSTLNQGWYGLNQASASGGSGTELVDGYPGYTYQFRARAHTAAGLISSWSPVAATTVASNATFSHAFKELHTLDGYGGIQSDDSAPLGGGPSWPGWRIARAAHPQPGSNAATTGFVLDGWGGLQPYGSQHLSPTGGPYWPNWDIARDFAWLPNGLGGYVLDGWGGLHPFALSGNQPPPNILGNAYWPGWDIAKKVVIFSDGSGGYVLDSWGGVHGFGIGGSAPVANGTVQNAYWPNWNIARDIVLLPNSRSGYTLDGYGGIHAFAPAGQALPPPITGAYWPNWDIARSLWLLPGSTSAGYTLDGWGGVHAFGGTPPIARNPYWPGWDIALGLFGA